MTIDTILIKDKILQVKDTILKNLELTGPNSKGNPNYTYIFRFVSPERYKEIKETIQQEKLIKFNTYVVILNKTYHINGFYKEDGNVIYFDHECVSKVEE